MNYPQQNVYSHEDLYKMTLIVLANPNVGHKCRGFWQAMIKKYDKSFFGNRDSDALRCKWRKITKENSDLSAFAASQEAFLKKEVMENIKQTVEAKTVPYERKRLPRKRFERRGDEGIMEQVMKEAHQKKLSKLIDLQKIVKKGTNEGKLNALANQCDLHGIDPNKLDTYIADKMKEAQGAMVIRNSNEDVVQVKNIIGIGDREQITKFLKLDNILQELSRKYDRPFDELCKLLQEVSGSTRELENLLQGKKVVQWNELEDIALRQPTDAAMYERLIKLKGEDNIKKRSEYFGLAIMTQ